MEFTTLVSLKNYQNKINNFQQGEIIYLTEDKKYVMYDGQDFIDIPEKVKVDSESGVHMSLYDLNKTIIAQLPVKETYAEQSNERKLINNFFNSIGRTSYMLLCKDISYYTIFTYEDNKMANYETLGEAVLDCLQSVGQLICADLTEDGNAVEIWIRTEEDNLCMYLFKCSDLMVTYGGNL